MKFIYPGRQPTPGEKNVAFIYEDSWDDWFTFTTTFTLIVIDQYGEQHNIGSLKIGEIGLTSGRAKIPDEFHTLPDSFFSLGQNESYYEAIEALPTFNKNCLKKSLRDIAINLDLYDRFKFEKVTINSLMRFVSESTIRERFNKIVSGTAKLTKFSFIYESPIDEKTNLNYSLQFNIEPQSLPPSNIHVLIGRNGVGKTTCVTNILKSLMLADQKSGTLNFDDDSGGRSFPGLVNVSFSAFDSETVIKQPSSSKIKYNYVGLSKEVEIEKGKVERLTKSQAEICNEFHNSLKNCINSPRQIRWLEAVKTLESDPIFQDSKISSITDGHNDLVDTAMSIYNKFSSGHKIILLTITKLVELVDERTLVFLDEPEGHLHPPLLSAFIRALTDLLITRNGVAIIATHSPVVLQEVPSSCVSIINRSGRITDVRRPEIETFGENVGTLTREIFGLEVMQSGFHKLLELQIQNSNTYEEAVNKFNNQLGSEAKLLLRGMMSKKNRGES
ncbi:TPA: ATP-binding protein [Aeromonas hydrophila]|nr:ATP-binding protein [Aeromonas hydrophila]HAT2494201.1 ATP-binding protein [Aeromonas hydrophila]HAT2509847.1 ATP-binding protein [Aeromonas hydrophila]HAT2530295.1 ATP-binding protein [Aeromonas hydrophila]